MAEEEDDEEVLERDLSQHHQNIMSALLIL